MGKSRFWQRGWSQLAGGVVLGQREPMSVRPGAPYLAGSGASAFCGWWELVSNSRLSSSQDTRGGDRGDAEMSVFGLCSQGLTIWRGSWNGWAPPSSEAGMGEGGIQGRAGSDLSLGSGEAVQGKGGAAEGIAGGRPSVLKGSEQESRDHLHGAVSPSDRRGIRNGCSWKAAWQILPASRPPSWKQADMRVFAGV